MTSSWSLRFQLVLVLVLALGAQTLVGVGVTLPALERAFEAERLELAELQLEQVRPRLETCRPDSPVCVHSYLDPLIKQGIFQSVRLVGGDGLIIEAAQPTREATREATKVRQVAVAPHGRLEGAVRLGEAQRRTARVISFLFGNLLALALVLGLAGTLLFNRFIARPVEQLTTIAERLGHLQLDGTFGTDGGTPALGQLGSALERMARALKEEQARTHSQIDALTRMNVELQSARDSLVRQEKLATVGRLAAGIAHEVGNPLGGILGYAELLRMKGDPSIGEYADRIEREVGRIDKTVRGLLDFSRPREVALQPLSLAHISAASAELCRADKRLRSVKVHVEVSEATPLVLADEHQLGQVVVNLLLNAGDAMADQYGEVWLRAREVDAAHVELLVEDTGPGVPPELMGRIFDPFFTTKEVGQGTGLGLSICASIMDSLSGDIRVETRAEGGARFILRLRRAPSAPPVAT
jgi:signal transduction histidine kinase